MFVKRFSLLVALICLLASGWSISLAADEDVLTVYSGRNESLIGPLMDQFVEDTGIEVEVLYGGTSAVANQILTEGDNSPADVFIAQDGGALGALAAAGMLSALPEDVLNLVVDSAFVSPDGVWVGLSGRARVLVYSPEGLDDAGLELPDSILDLTGDKWRGGPGGGPANPPFFSKLTAPPSCLGRVAAR
ncbi:MAG: extracellular solute-binding protein, partial [Chloroflexi bacterium]|nr:extracellular solute-binding protein [Chloroflexota bacterium]